MALSRYRRLAYYIQQSINRHEYNISIVLRASVEKTKTRSNLGYSIPETRNLFVCLSAPSQNNANPRKIRSQSAPGVDVYTACINSGYIYKRSGPIFGFHGALSLQLHEPAPPARQSLVCNRLCQSRVEKGNRSQYGYSAWIVTK